MTIDTPAIQAKIQALYQENLNRPGEPAGLAYYTTLATNGVTLDAIDTMMEASPEYAQLHGGSSSSILGGNGRAWLIAGVLGLVVVLVIRRAKK